MWLGTSIFFHILISVFILAIQFSKMYSISKASLNVSDNDEYDVIFLQDMGRKTDIAAGNSGLLAESAVILALSGTNFFVT